MQRFNIVTESILNEKNLICEQKLFTDMKAYCFVKGYDTPDEVIRMLAKEYKAFYESEYNKLLNEGWKNTTLHVLADLAGLIPGYGEIVDFFHALWYFVEGKPIMASLTLIGMLPILGDLAKIGKYVKFADAPAMVAKAAANPKIFAALQNLYLKWPTLMDPLVSKLMKFGESRLVKKFFVKEIRPGVPTTTLINDMLDFAHKWIGKLINSVGLGAAKSKVVSGLASGSAKEITKGVAQRGAFGVVGRAAETGWQRSRTAQTPYDKSLTTSAKEFVQGTDETWD